MKVYGPPFRSGARQASEAHPPCATRRVLPRPGRQQGPATATQLGATMRTTPSRLASPKGHAMATAMSKEQDVQQPPQHTTSEVEFFDRMVAEHGEYDVLSEGAYSRLLQAFRRRIEPRAGERAIDLGCGTGAFTRRLRPFGLALQGMDVSPKSVELANRAATTERYICGDITATNLPQASCDIVIYSGVLHHFATREARARVLAEGFRLLSPGGRLFA